MGKRKKVAMYRVDDDEVRRRAALIVKLDLAIHEDLSARHGLDADESQLWCEMVREAEAIVK